jgi:hypothetical protein
MPLDGNLVLAISPSKLGQSGSATEAAWLEELQREHDEDIIVWSPAGSSAEVEKISALLAKVLPKGRHPAIIQLEGRSDKVVLGDILNRLGVDISRPIIMFGDKAIKGGLAELKEMYEAKTLDAELARIGWLDIRRAKRGREKQQFVVVKAPGKGKGKMDEAKAEKLKAPGEQPKVEHE